MKCTVYIVDSSVVSYNKLYQCNNLDILLVLNLIPYLLLFYSHNNLSMNRALLCCYTLWVCFSSLTGVTERMCRKGLTADRTVDVLYYKYTTCIFIPKGQESKE
jgi:hypothetical protein